ncbi:MAG: alpha/beta hydrolase [Ectothiorhodospiraceae bacterium]|nr:alpha/beta hydrolase [Ectothiorhodospiraceae bacterium]MCH8503649.1 alpha/beta hydrolase [Ectothiorhodospiraceae bacterium]
MPYLTIGGDDIHYIAHEQDAEFSLLGIHGAGQDCRTWPASLGQLEGCNCYLLDLPGHGESGGSPREDITEYARVVTGFVQQKQLQRVVLMGHCMGGAIAQQIALDQPQWLQALILVSTGCRLRSAPDYLDLLRDDYPKAVEQTIAMMYGSQAPRHLVEQARERWLALPQEVLYRDMTACDGFDLTNRLSDIPHPTLILSGDIDHMTPLKYAQFMEDRLPGSRLAVIAPSGHMLPLEQPGDMVRLVREFIASHLRQ